MFNRFIKPAVVILALTAMLASCKDVLPQYDYQIDMEKYHYAISMGGDEYLVLVNKQNPVGDSYAPAEMGVIPSDITLYGKEISMEKYAALAAEALVRELHAVGYTDIVITSGYRSYTYQQSLFNTYMNQEKAKHPTWSQAQCEAEVLTYSARPGQSEHQTGLCMDLISTKNVVLDESFAANPAYAWLTENAHKFGFILRYPKDKEDVTGYSYEPWHYRFVGVTAAGSIHGAGITLEEYQD